METSRVRKTRGGNLSGGKILHGNFVGGKLSSREKD